MSSPSPLRGSASCGRSRSSPLPAKGRWWEAPLATTTAPRAWVEQAGTEAAGRGAAVEVAVLAVPAVPAVRAVRGVRAVLAVLGEVAVVEAAALAVAAVRPLRPGR